MLECLDINPHSFATELVTHDIVLQKSLVVTNSDIYIYQYSTPQPCSNSLFV